jgi:indolepyruvate ferredoxin oxidoreductase
VFINEWVCEGCGDCGVVSNCVSIVPEGNRLRPQARHRPVVVQQGLFLREGVLPELRHRPRRRSPAADRPALDTPCRVLPDPAAAVPDAPYGIVIAGIGGTGVVTIGALLGMAAHLEGKGVSVVDQTGLAQKNGTVGQPRAVRRQPVEHPRPCGCRWAAPG